MSPYYDEYVEALHERIEHLESENDIMVKVCSLLSGALIIVTGFAIYLVIG